MRQNECTSIENRQPKPLIANVIQIMEGNGTSLNYMIEPRATMLSDIIKIKTWAKLQSPWSFRLRIEFE
jgi:hypothetical protein